MHKDIMKKIYTILGFLVILSLILLRIEGVVDERIEFKNQAAESIAKSWGSAQTIEVPNFTYKKAERKDKKSKEKEVIQEEITNTATNIVTDVDIKVEHKKKGIYKIPVYTAKIKQKGEFKNIEIKNTPVTFTFKVKDPKGFAKKPTVKFNGNNVEKCTSYECKVYIKDETTIPYELEYTLRGTKELTLAANGYSETKIKTNMLKPEFTGDFLPVEHKNTNNGYEALWSIPEAASVMPQGYSTPKYTIAFNNSVDSHRMTERCVKYGFLFIALTFLAFFVYEITNRMNKHIHPFQYSLIGVSMLVFYLLLLSMSEFINFGISYLIAAVMTISLIGLYTYFVLVKKEDKKFPLAIAGILGFIYLYLYITVNLEELSLLAGSFGLFVTIVIVMYATKNVEWYKENGEKQK